MTAQKKAEPKKSTGKDLAAFRAQHDRNFIVPRKIEEAIKKLGPDCWEYEQPFQKLAEISNTDVGLFREKFMDFIVEVKGSSRSSARRIWCGSKALATKLRQML